MRKLTLLLTLLIALAGALGSHASAAPLPPAGIAAQIAPSTQAVTTAPLNLRSGPSLNDGVIAVMPAGTTVSLSGQELNGFLFVTWGTQKGWAHRDYLSIQASSPSPTATAITTEALNMRTGPGLSYPVRAVMPRGTAVTLTGQEANGFRSVSWNGQDGWAFGAYLAQGAPTPTPNEVARTTDPLNLRGGPSLADGVITVMPAGSEVTVTGPSQNGFYPITWSGYTGWAFSDYLSFVTAPPPPAPEPEPTPNPPGPQVTGVTTDALNLRAGPGTNHAVIAVMPRGAKVVLTGETSGSFVALSWNGQGGWAHRDWIAIDGSQPAPVETAATTADLNLRAGPGTTYAVLAVMPEGATVTLTGQTSNGFHSVSWNGQNGWAFSAWLAIGAAPPPPPPVSDPTTPPPFDVTNTIIGPTRGTAEQAIGFAQRAGALRMDHVELFIREIYRLAPQVGFDPAILVSQSALETGYWKSSWWNERLNPAGLGVTGDPQQNAASPTFPDGTIAARAQIAHMHAEVYGNAQALPPELQGVDPTYQRVFQAGWAGTIRIIDDLAGTWAVDPLYGHKIVRVAKEIYP